MSAEEGGEPPEWFTDLPESAQIALIAIGFPKSWAPSGFSYAPEWVQLWQQAAWLGWAAPASLAPFYASTMYRTAMRAGWMGDVGMYGYMGRAGEAGMRAQDYMVRAAREGGYPGTEAYNLSQASLWQARQAYWQTQQQWAPVAETWGAARLTSFMFPQFGLLRAFGFPFYAAGQRLTAAAAMAPYVQQGIAQDPAALARIMQSPMFWSGQYGVGGAGLGQTLFANLVSGVGEWTAAQSIIWSIRGGGGLNLGTMKQTAAIQLMQAGLGLAVEPITTLIARQMWGVPTTGREYLEMGAQTAIGAGLFGAGIVAGRAWGFIPRFGAAVERGELFNATEFAALQGSFSRLAALARVTGSIIGGQIGFELGAGLGTAYVDALARQGRDVGLARAIVPPVAGTAGLMIGSWAGARLAATFGGILPVAGAAYLAYGAIEDPYGQQWRLQRQAAQPWVPISPAEYRQYAGPAGAAPTLGQIGAYLMDALRLPSPAQRYGAVPPGGLTPYATMQPEMWAYGMRNVPGFGAWGGQATFQDWAMRQYAYNRVGTPFWLTQGYADWQMVQYGMRNVPGFATWGGQATYLDWARTVAGWQQPGLGQNQPGAQITRTYNYLTRKIAGLEAYLAGPGAEYSAGWRRAAAEALERMRLSAAGLEPWLVGTNRYEAAWSEQLRAELAGYRGSAEYYWADRFGWQPDLWIGGVMTRYGAEYLMSVGYQAEWDIDYVGKRSRQEQAYLDIRAQAFAAGVMPGTQEFNEWLAAQGLTAEYYATLEAWKLRRGGGGAGQPGYQARRPIGYEPITIQTAMGTVTRQRPIWGDGGGYTGGGRAAPRQTWEDWVNQTFTWSADVRQRLYGMPENLRYQTWSPQTRSWIFRGEWGRRPRGGIAETMYYAPWIKTWQQYREAYAAAQPKRLVGGQVGVERLYPSSIQTYEQYQAWYARQQPRQLAGGEVGTEQLYTGTAGYLERVMPTTTPQDPTLAAYIAVHGGQVATITQETGETGGGWGRPSAYTKGGAPRYGGDYYYTQPTYTYTYKAPTYAESKADYEEWAKTEAGQAWIQAETEDVAARSGMYAWLPTFDYYLQMIAPEMVEGEVLYMIDQGLEDKLAEYRYRRWGERT